MLSGGRGGVGFRQVREVYNAFSCKLWWCLRTGSSLWSQFMRAKYCNGIHPCQATIAPFASATWRRMVSVSRHVELSILWLVNEGECSFWYDNWLGSGALFLRVADTPHVSFAELVCNGSWNIYRLTQILPPECVANVVRLPVPRRGFPDEAVWMPTTSGKFSLASAYQEVRQVRNNSMAFSRIWQSSIPLKISFFMHRMLLRRLPLDDILGRMGFQLPSKCFCCVPATGEELEHVFSTGHLASQVWSYFQNMCGVVVQGSEVHARLITWWLSPALSRQQRFVLDVLPSLICWNIWKARNRAVFDGIQPQGQGICNMVAQDVKAAFEIRFQKELGMLTFPQFYEKISYPSYVYNISVVRWKGGGQGVLTLNTDGCSKGNPGVCGGGGVVRDSNGHAVFAFSAFLGEGTSLRAEALAALVGIRLCRAKGVERLAIQADSLLLIGILQGRLHCPWHIKREVEQILSLAGERPIFMHCYRESNKVADILSNEGVSHPLEEVRIYDSWYTIPLLARGEIRLNRLGVPSIRRIKGTRDLV